MELEFRGITAGTPATQSVAFGSVVITDADVNGVVLTPTAHFHIRHIRFEDQEFISVAGAEHINLQFRPFGDQLAPAAGLFASHNPSKRPSEWKLNIERLYPAIIRLLAPELPIFGLLRPRKSGLMGADVLKPALHFAAGARDGFEICSAHAPHA
jgi:hypothetical protein